jgi:hypothetical protein
VVVGARQQLLAHVLLSETVLQVQMTGAIWAWQAQFFLSHHLA